MVNSIIKFLRNSERASASTKYQNTHPFHLVDPSILPFVLSFAALSMILTGVLYMHSETYSSVPSLFLFVSSIVVLVTLMFVWWFNVVHESYAGFHTTRVQKGLKVGFILFIVSEIMFFLGFFWFFFIIGFFLALGL